MKNLKQIEIEKQAGRLVISVLAFMAFVIVIFFTFVPVIINIW